MRNCGARKRRLGAGSVGFDVLHGECCLCTKGFVLVGARAVSCTSASDAAAVGCVSRDASFVFHESAYLRASPILLARAPIPSSVRSPRESRVESQAVVYGLVAGWGSAGRDRHRVSLKE